MDFALNDEQREIREMVHDICLERVEPRAAEIDESGEFPWDIKELFAKHDILAIPFTPEYGGVSGSALTLIVAVEEISKFCATSSLILSVQSLGSLPIWLAGSEEQKRKYLPPLARGEQMAAFALTEPGSGSDAGGMRTRAIRRGETYVMNGSNHGRRRSTSRASFPGTSRSCSRSTTSSPSPSRRSTVASAAARSR